MDGKLFVYHPEKRLVAFQTGNFDHALVFIGGLTDGLLALPYLNELGSLLNLHNISLIQVILSSSYNQYGTCSLATDVEDLDALLKFLKETKKIKEISLLGHSTGCQDIVTFLKDGTQKGNVHKAILQGPVSDREYMATLTGTNNFLVQAKKMMEAGKGEELMPRSAYDVPITAYRFVSLAGYLGDDDLFSSDIPTDKLKELFAHISIPILWIVSGADQYVPPHISIPDLANTLQASIPKSELLVLDGELHEISKHVKLFCESVVSFLTK
eukprot:Phypoly_transcript_16244.p1 GENE.Phypoly_transcript_16244~~Phypoly_transcript_16244.p1  ORF type:complete len:270 (+),score=37.89 Phypoly_transcript_16244:62-871(+)